MRNWFAQTVDQPAVGMPQGPHRVFSRIVGTYEEAGARARLPLVVALLSVAFQEYPIWIDQPVKLFLYDRHVLDLLGAGLLLAAVLAAFVSTSRLAVGLFAAIAVIAILPDWSIIANHTYLALWTIPMALLFKEWWTSDLYAFYLRITLAIVMFAAFSQKIMAGTYLDGSYIAWLSQYGGLTERTFSFLCTAAASEPCIQYRLISIFILAWQLTVGILLALGVNSLVFLAIEIGFLLGAGYYADEMNFQILNIALLCVVFRFGMPLWLFAGCVGLLVIDYYGIGTLVKAALAHAA